MTVNGGEKSSSLRSFCFEEGREIFTVEIYLRVRRAHYQDGLSGREIARQFGISRDSARKMLVFSEPPGYRWSALVRRPKLDAFTDQIDQWLLEDKSRHRKQRHTAKRVFDRLTDECGFTGGYTIVKDYIREQNRVAKRCLCRSFTHQVMHKQTLAKQRPLSQAWNRRCSSSHWICPQ